MSIFKQLVEKSYQYARWYCNLEDFRFASAQREILQNFYIMQQTLVEAEEIDSKWAQQQQLKMSALLQLYRSKGGSFGDEEEGY